MKPHTIHKSYSHSKKEVGEKLERQAFPSKLPTKEKVSVDLQWLEFIPCYTRSLQWSELRCNFLT